MLTGEINKINTSLSNINTKFNVQDKFNERLDKLFNAVENKIVKQNNNNNNLALKGNPFYDAAQEYDKENSDSDNEEKKEISSNEMDISQSQMDISQPQNNVKKASKI